MDELVQQAGIGTVISSLVFIGTSAGIFLETMVLSVRRKPATQAMDNSTETYAPARQQAILAESAGWLGR